MATKTFKIGEYCAGGIVKAIIKNNNVGISLHDWNSKEKITSAEFGPVNENYSIDTVVNDVDTYLNLFTTSYYSEQVSNWVKSKLQ